MKIVELYDREYRGTLNTVYSNTRYLGCPENTHQRLWRFGLRSVVEVRIGLIGGLDRHRGLKLILHVTNGASTSSPGVPSRFVG